MDINLTGQIWDFPIHLIGQVAQNQTLANPIVLHGSINATLSQPDGPWWASNAISTFVTAIVTILAVYLGQRWAKSSESEKEFHKARRRAYMDFITLFSQVDPEVDWPSDTVVKLWKAALDAGQYGRLRFKDPISYPVKELFKGYFDRTERDFVYWLEEKSLFVSEEPPIVKIRYIYDYIIVLEILQMPDTSSINKVMIMKIGQEFFPVIRDVLLQEGIQRARSGKKFWKWW
jgi:hypothetical protein